MQDDELNVRYHGVALEQIRSYASATNKSPGEVLTDALKVYGDLFRMSLQGKSLYVGTSGELHLVTVDFMAKAPADG